MAKAGGTDSKDTASAESAAGPRPTNDSPAPAPNKGEQQGGKAGTGAKIAARLGFLSVLTSMAGVAVRRANDSLKASITARLAQFGLQMPQLSAKLKPHETENILRALQTLAGAMERAQLNARATAKLKLEATAKPKPAPRAAPRRAPLPQLTPKPPTFDNN